MYFYEPTLLTQLAAENKYTVEWNRGYSSLPSTSPSYATQAHISCNGGSVYLATVPACCGVLFLTHLAAYASSKGYGQRLLQFCIEYAKQSGYGAIQCIISDMHGEPLTKKAEYIFEKHGFTYLKGSKFVNPRSDNTLKTYQLILPKVEEEE